MILVDKSGYKLMGQESISVLYEFIDIAEQNNKYPPNTAHGLRAALKVFDAAMSEQERGSIQTMSQQIPQIFESVAALNRQFSAVTLMTYRSRFKKVLHDYVTYGRDRAKIVKWQPRTRKQKDTKQDTVVSLPVDVSPEPAAVYPTHTLSVALQNRRSASLHVPADLQTSEAELLAQLLRTLVAR